MREGKRCKAKGERERGARRMDIRKGMPSEGKEGKGRQARGVRRKLMTPGDVNPARNVSER